MTAVRHEDQQLHDAITVELAEILGSVDTVDTTARAAAIIGMVRAWDKAAAAGDPPPVRPTKKAKLFMVNNDKSKVVSGSARERGGGTYRLANGRTFSLSLEDARSMPDGYPKWDA